MTNLILCGGSGTRLWPLSRNSLPKEFYPLLSGHTLFEDTVLRNKPLAERFWVASSRAQQHLAEAQLTGCGVERFGSLVEPVGRNTAPAITLVCLSLPRDELVFVTPSDHVITRKADYQAAVARAKALAEDGYLVTFGIRPTFPETGFGYIEAEGEVVVRFHEKPDAAAAEAYVQRGHYWNSGMFVFRAGAFLDEMERHAPELLAACRRAPGAAPSMEAMTAIPAVSVDYALMEKSDRVRVVPCDLGWSDLGSFDSLMSELPLDADGNAVLGNPKPLLTDSRRNLVVSTSRLVALVDVEDLLVVDTPDALLIVRRGDSQKVREVVEKLRSEHPDLLG